jgi:formamidopyrimidine-DNA glycosylase
VLMDQRHLAGVGNIYANEALFAAGIDPSKPACRLTPDDHRRLHAEIQRILEAAIASNGSTVRDYRTGTGAPGSFQLELLVYGREGEPCRRCGTRLTGTHLIDARISVFCHRCQS